MGTLDHISPHNIPQSVIYLNVKQGVKATDAFAHLREGLRRTLLQVPWLSGLVRWQCQQAPGWRPGQLEIQIHGKTTTNTSDLFRFKELDTRCSYADLRNAGFPLDAFDDKDIISTQPWNPDYDKGVPVFAAQANFLPGGCILALSIASPASDGTAMLMVIKLWADHCSSLLRAANEVVKIQELPDASFDRASLDETLVNERGTVELRFAENKTAWQLIGMQPDQTNHLYGPSAAPTGPDGKHAMLYMPHTAYSTPLRECVSEFGNTDIGGNDLICALIWRSLMRAWAMLNASQAHDTTAPGLTELLGPFDARPTFAKFLQGTYLGNMNFENRIAMPLRTLISPDTNIASVAHAIRTGVDSQASAENLLDAFALLRSAVPDYNQVQWRATHAMGASVGILSLIMLPFNETCFGDHVFGNGGKPDVFCPLMGACNRGFRTCFVMPRKEHGGLEFIMTLSKEEMDFLGNDEEFCRYAFPLE